MRRKGLVTLLALLFAVSPLLGAAQKAGVNDSGDANHNKVTEENDNEKNRVTQSDDDQDVASAADLKALVEQLAKEGAFENDQAVHALTLHLTAVSHFEKTNKKDKVVKHMKGFRVLLDHQKKDGLILEDAYNELKADADALIEKWNALQIVKDGQARAVILIAQDADNEISKAADTLVEYAQKSTGAELPVMTEEEWQGEGENGKGDTRIYIGQSAPGEKAHIEEGLKDMDDQGFLIHPANNSVTIVGPSDAGTLNGVSEFLERYVGVRWLMTGPDGVDVPKSTDLSVVKEDVRQQPAFRYRRISAGVGGSEFLHRNKLQGAYSINFIHNLYNLFPVEKYGETHPEFYPDDNPSPNGKSSWEPCFTVKGTVDAAVSGIIDYFDNHPDATSYSLGVNDNSNYCEADPDNPHYPGKTNSVGYVDMSDIYYKWVNEVVEQVREVYPDKWFGLLAYNNVMDPPSFKLNSHVIPFLTKDRMTWIDDGIRKENYEQMDAWNKVASQMAWYEYMYGTFYMLPRVYPHRMAKNYQYAENNHVIGNYTEMYFNAGDGPKAWVSMKLQWNPDQDVDELLDEWYTRAVGKKAAPDLKAYYDLWEDFWTNRIKGSTWFEEGKDRTYLPGLKDASYLTLVTDKDLQRSEQLLDSVVTKAQTDQQKKRAKDIRRMGKYYEASVLSYPNEDKVQIPANEQEALQLLDEIKQSLEYGQERNHMIDEFANNPALEFHVTPRVNWTGIQHTSFQALENYVQSEPEGGKVGEKVDEFLSGLPENIRNQFLADTPGYSSADAVKTTASKDDILQSLDFSQGPWKEAKPISDFYVMDTVSEAPVETKVYLLWDDENYYVGYENFDSDLQGTKQGWRGNSDQTFVAAERDGTMHGYLNDPDADKFSYIQDPDGNREEADTDSWETTSKVMDDRWNAVKVIPFSDIGVDPNKTDKIWSFFFRNYHDQSVLIGWQGRHPWNAGDLRPIHLVE